MQIKALDVFQVSQRGHFCYIFCQSQVTWEWNILESLISSIRAQIVADRIEKRCQVDELDFAGLRFAAVGCRSIDLDSIYFRSWQPICEKLENMFLYF